MHPKRRKGSKHQLQVDCGFESPKQYGSAARWPDIMKIDFIKPTYILVESLKLVWCHIKNIRPNLPPPLSTWPTRRLCNLHSVLTATMSLPILKKPINIPDFELLPTQLYSVAYFRPDWVTEVVCTLLPPLDSGNGVFVRFEDECSSNWLRVI